MLPINKINEETTLRPDFYSTNSSVKHCQ